MEHMLVISHVKECAVALERPAERCAKLGLLAFGLERHERMPGIEHAVAQIGKSGAVEMVGAGLGHDINHCPAGSSKLRAVSVGRNTELLYHFIGKLVGGAIASAGLGEKCVVIIGSIHQVTGLE